MRKILFFLALLLIPSVSAPGADFYVIEITPNEMAPGETTQLDITLKNLGTELGAFVRAELDPSDTSPINALDSSKVHVTKAEAAEEGCGYFGAVLQRDSVPIQYRVKVDDNATTGAYDVPLILTWQDVNGAQQTQTVYLGVDVKGEPHLVISGIESTPERVYPDTEFTLNVDIENIGTAKAKSVEAALKLPAGITGEDRAYPGTIKRDTIATASYTLKATKEAKSSAYDFTLSLDYTDEQGASGKIERPFKVFVSERGDIDLEIAGISTSPAKIIPGTDFTLSVQLENIGTQDAKSVMVTISDSEGFVGEFSSFVGKIESDDVSSGIFDLTAIQTATPGDHQFNMEVIFTDETGEEFSETKTFNVYIDTPSQGSVVGKLVAVLVILAIAVVLWRRRKAAAEIVE